MSFATELQTLKNAINTFSVKIKNKFDEYIPLSLRNAINGVAPLDENRLIPVENLPLTEVAPDIYGDSVNIPVIMVDSRGRIIGITTTLIRLASDTETGIVQLNNTLTSTSVEEALTAAQGKILKDSKQDNLGFTPEDSSKKGAVSGYCPLDINRLVPIANIPGIHKNYDLHNFVNGKPLVYEVLMRAIAVRAFTIPANCAGSFAYCTTPATSAFSIGILKNGVQIGTINYAAGATAATFTLGTALVLNPGDQFALKCIPGTQDATLSDLTIAIYADAS